MFKVYKKEIEVAGKKISLETGKVARQADGAIIATCGETVVLATVVGAKKVNPDMDYFPLSVNYQEKYYAAGKIPGGYFKREARPTESETLISRLIDRPIRPLFPDEFKNEVQLLPTVISYDKENEPDILSITASSAALAISGMPFMGPVGASRVGFVDGKYVLNPSKAELEKSKLDLVVAGTKDAVLMVESEANGLTEEEMLNAVKFGHEGFVPVIEMIEELAKECRKPEWTVEKKDLSEVKKKLEETFTEDLKKAFATRDKQDRSNQISEITDKAKKLYEEDENYTDLDVNSQLKNLEKSIVRTDILKNKNRIDGRGLSDVRPIECEVGVLPRAHGSALFTRGETQAIVVATLGTSDDEQRIESLDGLQRERFMLHYNFPPFSVGETGRIGTGRREIGHGKLAWRAINSSLPTKEAFPYTFRVVSEITESNGSSSMAFSRAFSTLRLPLFFLSTFIAATLSRICGACSSWVIHSDSGLLKFTLQGILIPELKITILGLISTGSSKVISSSSTQIVCNTSSILILTGIENSLIFARSCFCFMFNFTVLLRWLYTHLTSYSGNPAS